MSNPIRVQQISGDECAFTLDANYTWISMQDMSSKASWCERRHHRLLHSPSNNQVQPDTQQESNRVNSSCNVHSALPGGVLLKYVPVTLHGNGRSVDTIALLDDGSSATFMEHDLLMQLGISGTPRPLCISWTGNQSRVEEQSVELSVKISGAGASTVYDMKAVHTVRTLGLCSQTVTPTQLAAEYNHLKGLPLLSYQNVSAKILIESLGLYRPIKRFRSDDEERALNILASNVRLIDGHFEASLLWKYDMVKLPNSRAMALKRHECLERKLR
uniref:Peptidase aspartic putative domain-containing protein n=1 Tax=Anopheles arabiensis TaxID=7173 RepID=A0A182HGJ0_ANOAR